MKIYGILNQSSENIVLSSKYTPSVDEILMQSRRPSPEHVATIGGVWELVQKSFEEMKVEKYQEIIKGADAVINIIRQGYSIIEVETWNSQEAGAMYILGKETTDSVNDGAIAIFSVPEALAVAVMQVESLAEKDRTTKEEFALRIWNNATEANMIIRKIWGEQRDYERALKLAITVEELQTIIVSYALPA